MKYFEVENGIIRQVDIDHKGNVAIKSTQDVEPYLDANKRSFNDTPEFGKFSNGNLHKVASLPPIVVEQFFKEGINVFKDDPETIKRILKKLDSPEYKFLKTKNVRLS